MSRQNGSSVLGTRPAFARIHDRDTLISMIMRERARVERRGGYICLVIFRIPSDDAALADQVADVALRRKRLTDEVGRYEDGAIAALLPDTGSRGARVFAEDVCRIVARPIRYTLYCFPEDNSSGSDEDRPGRKTSEGAQEFVCDGVFDLQPLLEPKLRVWKRGVDVIASLSGLILLSPLFAAVALYIKAVSPGPAFYRQERLGKGRKPFQLLKFRSMKLNADQTVHRQYLDGLLASGVPMTKLDSSSDSRIIPLGRLLRWSCLDELPQLINVLRGEMSLVGPRPCLSYEAEKYKLWHRRRFDVLPGITGLWQVSGKNRLTFNQMVRMDIKYSLYRSFLMDIRIILRTAPTVFGLLSESLRDSPVFLNLRAQRSPAAGSE